MLKPILSAVALVAMALPVLSAESVEARFLRHVDWITEHSDLEYNGEPLPLFVYESRRGLQVKFYGLEAILMAEADDSLNVMTVEAIYDRFDDVVFLLEGEPTPDYVLVHEAVHYLQDINGRFETFACVNESEGGRLSNSGRMARGSR